VLPSRVLQSEEDIQLKDLVELWVEMLKNPDPDVQEHALDTLRWVLYHLGAMSVCFTGT
jgi:hypothetical protein